MASKIGDLVVRLIADTKQFVGGMERSKSALKTFRSGLPSLNVAIAAAVASAAALSAAVAFLVKNVKRLDEVAHQVKRTGLGAEALAGFTLAAELGGSSAEVASRALDKFTRNMGKAGDKTSKTSKAFHRLGIDSAKLAELTPDKQIMETVRAISALPTQAERAAAAYDLFGKGSASLVEVLSGGTEELEAMNEKAKELGLVLSTEELQAIEDVDDAMTMLGQAFAGAAAQITADFAPRMLEVIEMLMKGAKEASITSKWLTQLFNVGGKHEGMTKEQLLAKRDAIVASGKFPGGSDNQGFLDDLRGAEAPDLSATTDDMTRIFKETERFTDAVKKARIEGEILQGRMTEIDATIQGFAEKGVDPSILGRLRIQLEINKAIEEGQKKQQKADAEAKRAAEKRKRDNDRIRKSNEQKLKAKDQFLFNERLQGAKDFVKAIEQKAKNKQQQGFAGIAGRGSSEALEIIKRSRGPGKEALREHKLANQTLKAMLKEARDRKLAQFELQEEV